jgi:hypothetical protein
MSDTFLEEVAADLAKHRSPKGRVGIAIFRAALMLASGVLVTVGLAANGIAAPYLFGIATTFILIWIRGEKST